MTVLGRLARVGPLVVLGVAGFLLGSCGGGESALTTGTGLTATRPAETATRPAVPTHTTPTDTEPATTTTEQPTTTEHRTVTAVETRTTLVPVPTTTATAEEASSTSDTPWGWIALASALAGAAVIGLILWRRRHTKSAAWSRGLADLSRRSLLALDDVVAEGSLVTGQVQTLADEARSLQSGAPDDPSRAAAAGLRVRLDDLATALEEDRRLRLGSTPPSEEKLAYSTSLVRHQLEQLQDVLRPADPGQGPG